MRITETVGVRKRDQVFPRVDSATRLPQAVKSRASSADVPMPTQLETRLRAHLLKQDGKSELLFANRKGRPFSANKLREKQLHPLLVKLGIPRGGFHSMRHGAARSLLADGATPAVVQKQLRHSDPRITLGIYGHVVGNQQRDAVEHRSARIAKYGVN
jgi:integrase